MAIMWTMGILMAFIIAHAQAQDNVIFYGFDQQDYSDFEGTLTVRVFKEGANTGPFTVTVTPLTFSEFEAQNFLLPSELANITRDPAEPGDFDSTPFSVTFNVSANLVDEMDLDIVLTDDAFHELDEGFYLIATVNQLSVDSSNSMAERDGVALITIFNNDQLVLRFERPSYTFAEDVGEVNDVIVLKDMGVISEVNLPVLVTSSANSAERDTDYEFPDGVELLFSPTDSNLSVSFTIFEDAIVEARETFSLQLSVPVDATPGYSTISPGTITITDNDAGVIGFERTQYTVSEGAPSVEVCVVLIEPQDPANVSADVLTLINVMSSSDTAEAIGNTAEGGQVDYEDFSMISAQFIIPRTCYDIVILEDSIIEDTEQFSLGGVIFLGPSFSFAPSLATVLIEDNDLFVVVNTTSSEVTEEVSTDDSESATTAATTTTTTTTTATLGLGGDPHFSILLPTGQLLCFSVQGEHGFTFNLITNDQMHVNALFIPDDRRSEVTWIGSLGIVVKGAKYKMLNDTELRFVAKEGKIYLGDKATLNAKGISKIQLADGKLTLVENEEENGLVQVDVLLEDVGLEFSVRFVKGNHLDMVWKRVLKQSKTSHGIIGQFFRDGVEVDETRGMLQLPSMEPVPVMRKPVWHFMEREIPEEQLCWVAMNPGYQGKRLIEGHYLDYLVEDVLSSDFSFKN